MIWYASFIFALSFLIRYLYSLYCTRYFGKVVKYQFALDKNVLKEIWSFVSWAYLGSFSGIAKEQGVNIIIGHYFGVTINAARGVSMQVYNAVLAFGNNFISALRPQIIKSYGAGDIPHAINLTAKGIKITFYLMYFIILPLVLECPFVLGIWLVDVPYKAVVFTRLVLILCLMRTFQDPVSTLYLAIGKIKKSQILAAVYTVLCLLMCMVAFGMGASPEVSVWISMILEILNLVTVCYLLDELIKVDWFTFIRNSMLPILKVVVLTIPGLLISEQCLNAGVIRFLIVSILSVLLNSLVIYYVGLDKSERSMIVSIVKNKLGKK